MSTLSNIFATDDADPASDGSTQSASADQADIAPGTPGYEPDDEKPPEVLVPGGEYDPAA